MESKQTNKKISNHVALGEGESEKDEELLLTGKRILWRRGKNIKFYCGNCCTEL